VNVLAELFRSRIVHALPEITEAEAREMLRPLGCGAQAVTQETPVSAQDIPIDDLDQPDTLESR
jgi:hypothetical protein